MKITIFFRDERPKKIIDNVYKINYLRSDLFGLDIKIMQIFYVIPERLKDGELYEAEPLRETFKIDNIEQFEIN